MLRDIRSWPVTLFGLLTIGLFLVAEAGVEVLNAVLPVIIVPLWLMRYVVVAVGGVLFGLGEGAGFPVWYDVLTVPVLLLPYIAADLALNRAWHRPRPENARAL